MGRVAVAGGTGAVGRTLVEVLVKSEKHEVFVLTRKLPPPESRLQGVSYLVTSYADIEGTTQCLEDNSIDTIISAIAIESDETSQGQIDLITAADKSSVTTRFIPSEYGFIATEELLTLSPVFQYWLNNASTLKATNLHHTRIVNGFFLDYWGTPHLKSHLHDFPWAIHIPSATAAIPGSGDDVLSMTYSFDMAAFIARLLDVDGPEWPAVCALSGQDVTFNQVLKWAEEARGVKFEVKYDSEETLKEGQATVLKSTGRDEMVRGLTSLFGRMVVNGQFRVGEERENGRFEEVRFMRVDEMIREAWKGR